MMSIKRTGKLQLAFRAYRGNGPNWEVFFLEGDDCIIETLALFRFKEDAQRWIEENKDNETFSGSAWPRLH